MNEIQPSNNWFCQNLKENEFFPRKVEGKSQQKYDALYFSKYLGIYLWAFGYLIKLVFFCVLTLEIPTIGVVSIIYTESTDPQGPI